MYLSIVHDSYTDFVWTFLLKISLQVYLVYKQIGRYANEFVLMYDKRFIRDDNYFFRDSIRVYSSFLSYYNNYIIIKIINSYSINKNNIIIKS